MRSEALRVGSYRPSSLVGKALSRNISMCSRRRVLRFQGQDVSRGGGWILGDFPTHERFVRDLVADSGFTAVFVNYTPSPEARNCP